MRILLPALALMAMALVSCTHQGGTSNGTGDARVTAMAGAASEARAGSAPAAPDAKPLIAAWAKPAPARRIAISAVTLVEPLGVPRRFGRMEFVATLANVAATRPYEANPGLGGIDLYALFTPPGTAVAKRVNGFWDGSSWRIRFAPDRVGGWSYTVTARDSSGTATTAASAFTVDSSSNPGFVRTNGRTRSFSDSGAPFFGIGHNTGWQYEVRTPSFDAMVAAGEDLLSFWIAVPWAKPSEGAESWRADRAPLENADRGVGNYQQEACRYLDAVIADAEQHGVYLQPSLWSHGQLRSRSGHGWGPGWYESHNAYAQLGVSASDFFRTTTSNGAVTPQWRHQQNYLRYVIARWGHSTAIAGWITVVELEGTTGWIVNPTQATAWCAKVAAYFRANDPYRLADQKYPIATSRSNAPSWAGPGDERATDSYKAQYDDVGVANAIATDTIAMRLSGLPSFHSEFGGDTTATAARATQPAHLHNGLWAGVATGACMSPLVWTDGGAFPLLTDPIAGVAMTRQLQRYAEIVRQWPEVGDPTAIAAQVSVPAGHRAWGMMVPTAGAQHGFVWAQALSGALGSTPITVRGLASEVSYRCDWYDTWTVGLAPLTEFATTDAAGTLVLSAPDVLAADAALHVERGEPPSAFALKR